MLAEALFQLTARDAQSLWLEHFRFRVANTQSALLVGVEFFVPQDRALVVATIQIHCKAGASQTISFRELFIQERNPVQDVAIGDRFYVWRAGLGSVEMDLNFLPVNLVIPPSHIFVWQVTFSAATNPNNVEMSVLGVEIPRGNVGL